jgi:Flp pilus assembly pilin Flp
MLRYWLPLLTRLQHRVARFLRESDEGQDLVEYALLASLVAVASGLFAPELTESMEQIYSKLAVKLSEAGG